MDRKIAQAFLIALTLAGPAGAAAGDTVADRVLGQRRLNTSLPFLVDGRVFSASPTSATTGFSCSSTRSGAGLRPRSSARPTSSTASATGG
jgi:hypothetical protein